MTEPLFNKLSHRVYALHREFFLQGEVDLPYLVGYLAQGHKSFSPETYLDDRLMVSLGAHQTNEVVDENEGDEVDEDAGIDPRLDRSAQLNYFCEKILSERETKLEGFDFQPVDAADARRVSGFLAKLHKLVLVDCRLYGDPFGSMDNRDRRATVCFIDCVFVEDWLSRGTENPPAGQSLFERCTFEKNAVLLRGFGLERESTHAVFTNCQFGGELSVDGFGSKVPLFSNTEGQGVHAKSLSLMGCDLRRPLALNHAVFERVTLRDCTLRKKFEFKKCSVGVLLVANCSFERAASFHGGHFASFRTEHCVFKELVGFESCVFGKPSATAPQDCAVFDFVSFMGLSNFRNAQFVSGLDICQVNLKEVPNFLECVVSFEGTNRESFRLIKHSFERVGNQVDANRFLVLELRKRKVELRSRPWYDQERLVLSLNDAISSFGQSYLRPIGLIVLLAAVFSLLQFGHEQAWLYSLRPSLNGVLAPVASVLNHFALGLLPFAKLFTKGMEFLSLVFYVLFSVLFWQTVVAVKRHTKNS